MSGSESDLQGRLRVEQPHSARIWNYLLGGKDNFESDRAAAEAVLGQMPEIREFAQAGRRLLSRAIGFLAGEVGIRDRKSTRLNSSHMSISYAVFCLKKKK